jgi:hypothetical protein
MVGGNSRSNASISVTVANGTNISMVAGQTYYIDQSADAMIMFVPTASMNNTQFTFFYSI